MFKKTIKLWTVAFFFIWESFLFNIKLFTENVHCVDFSSETDARNFMMQFIGMRIGFSLSVVPKTLRNLRLIPAPWLNYISQ